MKIDNDITLSKCFEFIDKAIHLSFDSTVYIHIDDQYAKDSEVHLNTVSDILTGEGRVLFGKVDCAGCIFEECYTGEESDYYSKEDFVWRLYVYILNKYLPDRHVTINVSELLKTFGDSLEHTYIDIEMKAYCDLCTEFAGIVCTNIEECLILDQNDDYVELIRISGTKDMEFKLSLDEFGVAKEK